MTEPTEPKSSEPVRIGLRQQVLLAALECSSGDMEKTFTAEELLLAAWKRDPAAWGLRGHETEHPDSEKIYKELDRVSVRGKNVRGGLVSLGLLEKVAQRTFRITAPGIVLASEAAGTNPELRATAVRRLADAVSAILSHPVLAEWIRDPTMPKYFRDGGHFWGIAAGTPPSVIRARIATIDRTLEEAKNLLRDKGVDEIAARHGKALFDSVDIERAMEFQSVLKQRFSKDLGTLSVELT
jgi:hypothetical protein